MSEIFKIAYCAGHYIGTPGKRLPKALDPNETREWTLNDRVADHFNRAALEYEGVQTLRTDDPTGQTHISIQKRTAKANAWGADMYCDLHHDAAGRVFSGGGVEAYSYPNSIEGMKYRDAIYAAVIAAGGLKGNRSQPLQEKKFDSLALTNMPAVLIEYGFMDSTVDAPVILTDAYAKLVAYATMEGIAKVAGLKKRATVADKPTGTAEQSYTQEQFIRDVQTAIGAKVDGIAGPETISKTPTISQYKNRTHAVVEPVQKWLYALGYTDVGKADGVAGPKFTAALTAFQENNKCWADGEATAKNKTWRCLLGMK